MNAYQEINKFQIQEIKNIEAKLAQLEQRLDATLVLYEQHQISADQFNEIVDRVAAVNEVLEERMVELGVL